MSLQQQLDQLTQATEPDVPAEVWGLIQDGYHKILAQDLESAAVDIGSTAPEFSLQNATGEPVSLNELLDGGKIILTFYRGAWCPYCNLALRAYQQRLDEFSSLGARLVAICPQTPDHSLSQKEKENLAFEVLSDPHNEVAAAYGLRFDMPEEHLQLLETLGMPFSGFNDNDDPSAPLAATFIIDASGEITWRFVDRDYRRRAEPDDLISALK